MHLTSSLHQHEHSMTGVPNLQFPIRKPATQQEVNRRQARLPPYWQPLPIAHVTTWAPPSVGSAFDCPRRANPTVNCAHKARNLVCSFLMRIIPKPLPTSSPWKNCLPQNRSLVPKRWQLAALWHTNKVQSLKAGTNAHGHLRSNSNSTTY